MKIKGTAGQKKEKKKIREEKNVLGKKKKIII
jgi:hypothetical protein